MPPPDETLEMISGQPSSKLRESLAEQPVEFRATVHETQRRPFGLAPADLLGTVTAIALVIAVVMFATAAWIPGIVALGVVIGSGSLFVSAIRHDPSSPTALITSKLRHRALAAARFTALTARTRARAAIQLLRIRRRRHRLERAMRSQLEPLGEAVYREDRERAEALKAEVGQLEQALHSAEEEAAAVAAAAREQIDDERVTVQPTQAFPAVPAETLSGLRRDRGEGP